MVNNGSGRPKYTDEEKKQSIIRRKEKRREYNQKNRLILNKKKMNNYHYRNEANRFLNILINDEDYNPPPPDKIIIKNGSKYIFKGGCEEQFINDFMDLIKEVEVEEVKKEPEVIDDDYAEKLYMMKLYNRDVKYKKKMFKNEFK